MNMPLIRIDRLIKLLGEELIYNYEGTEVIHPSYFRILEKLGFPQPYTKEVRK